MKSKENGKKKETQKKPYKKPELKKYKQIRKISSTTI